MRAALRWLRRGIESRMLTTAPVILMYHRVIDIAVDPWELAVHPARFEEQIDALTRARRVVHFHDLVEAERCRSSSDKPLAAVTFDDGYQDVYRNARGILRRYNCPMTLFVTTGAVGSPREFWWDALCRVLLETEVLPPNLSLEIAGQTHHWSIPPPGDQNGRETVYREVWTKLRPLPSDAQTRCIDEIGRWAGCILVARETYRAMTRREVCDISDELVTIGAHTVTHPTLPAHSYEDQFREIAESRRVCEELIGGPVISFAYPFGHHDDATASAVRQAGFSWACTVNAGVVRPEADPVRLPRLFIGNWDGDEFQKRLAQDPFQ